MNYAKSVTYAGRVIMTILVLTMGPIGTRYANAQSCSGACIQVGPRLVSLNSEEGFLIDAILGGLLGSSVDLDVLDWNAIAAGEIDLLGFLDTLQIDLGVSSTSEVLTTSATLEEFFIAAAKVAEADGNTLLANALNALAVDVSGLSGTITLDDLLELDFPEGALVDVDLNVLDLITGLIQLYNYENVATTPSPVTIPGDSLGLSGVNAVIDTVTIYAQVVEPQVIVCDSAGATAHTAAIRLKADVDLVTVALNFGILGVDASLGQLGLYFEAARGDALMTLVDAFTPKVDITATPGVVDAYLGVIPDSVFWNRAASSASIEAALDSSIIGDVTFSAAAFDVDAFITAQSSALGTSGATPLVYNGAFPETQTAGNSATFIAALVSDLVNNLEANFQLPGGILPPVQAVIDLAVPLLQTVVNTAVTPLLTPILADFVDPLLDALGIGIGEMDVTVLGVAIDPACQECDLELTKSVDKTTAAVGDTLRFTLILDNGGPDEVSGLVVGDTLQPGFMFISSSATNGSYDESTGRWTLDPMPSGSVDTLEIEVKVNASGPYENLAQVTEAHQPDPDSEPGNMGSIPVEDDEAMVDGITVSPLPVELIEFTALQVERHSVVLSWATATETNNAGFDVQLQSGACESSCETAEAWSSIAFVDGAGNASEIQSYSYRVDDLDVGHARFRLKQIDFDGAFEYSPIVELFLELPSGFEMSSAYPNPFRSRTSVDLTLREPESVTVDVFDATGRRLTRLFEGLIDGYETSRIDFRSDGLPAGMYLIRIEADSFSEFRSVMLVK